MILDVLLVGSEAYHLGDMLLVGYNIVPRLSLLSLPAAGHVGTCDKKHFSTGVELTSNFCRSTLVIPMLNHNTGDPSSRLEEANKKNQSYFPPASYEITKDRFFLFDKI